MGFLAFLGRVLFSTIFILSVVHKVQDFGVDGGSALRSMEPKLAIFRGHVATAIGSDLPEVDPKYLLMAALGLEGVGALLFIFGTKLGAYLLLLFLAAVTPIMHDFYNFDLASSDFSRELIQFLKNLALFGALLYFLGMKRTPVNRPRKTKAKTN